MSHTLISYARRTAIATALVATAIVAANHSAATAAPAPFHLALSKAEPRVNDTISTSPATIKLWFTETVAAASTSIRVTGPAQHVATLSSVTVDTAAKSPAVVKVNEKLAAGKYTVEWKALADDGHPTTGSFVFTIRTASPR